MISHTELIANGSGTTEYQIHMTDGSIWRCDMNGDHWRKIGLSNEELQEKFDAVHKPPLP